MEINNMVLSRLFSDYIAGMKDKPRHTEKADIEAGKFNAFCMGAFPHNTMMQNELYGRMMDAAIEYEESGFIAGFKYAMALAARQEGIEKYMEQIPAPEENNQQKEAAQTLDREKKIVEEKAENIQPVLVDEVGTDCITTKQIAEMFETTNFKVVKRIESQIFPYLDEESKKYFQKVDGVNVQHKPVTFYKMNKAACQIYLKAVETKKKNFINIAGGYAKLQELMDKVFPAEKIMILA